MVTRSAWVRVGVPNPSTAPCRAVCFFQAAESHSDALALDPGLVRFDSGRRPYEERRGPDGGAAFFS